MRSIQGKRKRVAAERKSFVTKLIGLTARGIVTGRLETGALAGRRERGESRESCSLATKRDV